MSRLILICGLPASGKTTLAMSLEQSMPAVRLSPDEWMTALGFHGKDQDARTRIERLQWEFAQRVLSVGQPVVLEYGFWGRAERDSIRNWAHRNDIAVELRFLDVDREELWRRIELRNPKLADQTMAITRDEFLTWGQGLESPDGAELALYDASLESQASGIRERRSGQ